MEFERGGVQMGLEEREGEEKMLGRVHKSNDFHRKFSLRMREKGRGGERREWETGAMNNAMFWRKLARNKFNWRRGGEGRG